MSRHLVLVSLVAGGLVAACTDVASPPPSPTEHELRVVPDSEIRHVAWNRAAGPITFGAGFAQPETRGFAASSGGIAASSAMAPPLDRYEASFWAVAGELRSIQINYLEEVEPGEWQNRPYLRFTVPAAALERGPDGAAFLPGDSVLISITVDSASMVAQFEPSGLQFDAYDPAQLQIWYTGAHGDLDGDGDVDSWDWYVEHYQLGVFLQQSPGTSWHELEASHSFVEEWFLTGIGHFSGAAVSY